MDWKLEVIPVPVTDVDVAKNFYGEQVGFTVDHDTRVSDTMRIVQLTPPGSGCSIVIGTGTTTMPPGSLGGLQLVVADIDAAIRELTERGVAVSGVKHFDGAGLVDGRGGDWNSFAYFDDPDGNGWVLQESPGAR